MATTLMSNREQSDTEFRRNMLESLIGKILDDTLPPKNRIDLFEVFENNFSDIFHSRSLYDVLWKSTKDGDSVLRKRLISLARYIASKQELEVAQREHHKTLLHRQDTLDHTFRDEGSERVLITLDSINVIENFVSIRVTFWCYDLDHQKPFWGYDTTNRRRIDIHNGKPVHLTYFDTPLTNNFVMPDGDRVAIVLNEIIGKESARLDVVHFPADYVTTGFRPSVNRINEILDGKDDD